jgi:hypothetical protein
MCKIFLTKVWFQNRRSKERRMKQLSAMGNRRHYYRNSSRLSIADAQQQQQQQTNPRQHPDPISISLNHFNDNGRPAPPINPNDANFNSLDYFGQNNFNEFMIQNERIASFHQQHHNVHMSHHLQTYHADGTNVLNQAQGILQHYLAQNSTQSNKIDCSH